MHGARGCCDLSPPPSSTNAGCDSERSVRRRGQRATRPLSAGAQRGDKAREARGVRTAMTGGGTGGFAEARWTTAPLRAAPLTIATALAVAQW